MNATDPQGRLVLFTIFSFDSSIILKMKVSFGFFILLLFPAFQIHAQGTLSDSIPEITITDSKLITKSNQSNKYVQVIDKDELRKYAGLTISQIINSQSGIQINGAWSNPSKDQAMYLRGAKNDYTVILIDGMPLQDPSGIGGAIDLRLLNTNQIERIEIVKGAQTSLYGSDAIAGVINVITHKITKDGFKGSAQASVGSFSTLDGNINLNYKKGDNAIGGAFSNNYTEGISEAQEPENEIFDRDGFNQFNARLYIESGITKKFVVRPFYNYSKINADADAGSYTDSKDRYHGTMGTLGINSKYSHSYGTLNILLLNNQINRYYKSDFGDYLYKGISNTLDVYSDIKLNKDHTLVVGIDMRNQITKDENATIKDPRINTFSPYLSALGRYNRFSIQADARYTIHSIYDRVTFSLNPSFDIVQSILKWRMSIGTGFKSPSLSQLYGQWGANPDLKPEYGNTFESGLYLRKGALESNLVFFKRKIHDQIAYTDRYINFDIQQDQGLEVEAKINILKTISLKSNYTFLSGSFTTKNLAGADTTYTNLYRRPQHRFSTTFTYIISKMLNFNIDWLMNGKSTDLDFSGFPAKIQLLKKYHLVNTSLNYTHGKNYAYLSINNLFNADFQEVYGYNNRPLSFKIGYGLRWGE